MSDASTTSIVATVEAEVIPRWGPVALCLRSDRGDDRIMTTAGTDFLLIESAMPSFDAVIAEHAVVAADVSTTFRAALELDLLAVRTPLLTASMWVRGLPTRISGKAIPVAPRLVVGEGQLPPGWLSLGQVPDREIAFGAVGRFWGPVIEWRDVAQQDFSAFAEPGWGKIAADFSVLQYGKHSSLLSYQCRTVTTDPESRRRFLRYWSLIRPFVGHIMRAAVVKIKTDAESRCREGGR